jgi:arginyl-tRNA synthetase
MNVLERLRAAFAAATPPGGDAEAFAAAVRPATDPKFGDYQANGCMALAKQAKQNPRELAAKVAQAVDLAPLAEPPEVAGPGFLNIRLKPEWLASELHALIDNPALGLEPVATPKTVVIDFSSPNVAKPMHVGHVRSTVIGDSLSRILGALGHKVIKDNHLGDWGTQFGMIIWGWKTAADEGAFAADPVGELSRLYRLAQSRIKAGDAEVEEAARRETAKLHAGDPENRALWQRFMPHCLEALAAIYHRLGVSFDHYLGESHYDAMLAGVVADLEGRGLAVPSEGATVVFVEGFAAPFLVRKRDGASTYATTDLATIRYRVEHWKPDQVLYVVDHRQGDHFKQLFAVAKRWGYDGLDLQHIAFGTILGADRRPFKTREGDAVGLESLLDEAVAKARQVVDANSPDLSDDERRAVSEVVGLGAIKYADLSQNRLSDYVFDWDKMLALTGNTATYMQYAYARIQQIFTKAGTTAEAVRAARPPIPTAHPAERALAMQLLRWPEAVALAGSELKPNILTDYLFGLANSYSGFYEACPVVKAGSDELRLGRLALCDLTARTLRSGLGLLGIGVVDRM